MGRFEEYLLLYEADTSSTENMHEIFFTLSFISIIIKEEGMFKNAISVDDYDNFIKKCGKILDNSSETLNTIKNYITDETQYNDLKRDAIKAAKKSYEQILKGYNIKDINFISVGRVFGAGKSGKKILADCKIRIVMQHGKNYINISLKYGAGQTNSLSVKKILKLLYGIDLNQRGVGLLHTVYKTSYGKKAIDKAFKEFLKIIEKENGDWIYINTNMTWGDFNKQSGEEKKEISQLYKSNNSYKDYFEAKKEMNDAIEQYLEDNKNITDENYVELISYLLRSEKDVSYMYVAKGGNKIFFVPSEDALKNHKFTIDVVGKNTADFVKDLLIKIDDKVIIRSGLKFRWQTGQFMADLAQKGVKIDIDKNFRF